MPRAAGLWYEWHGREDGEVLILSPGLGGSARYWKPNLAALSEEYRVLAYDHRGTGRSDRALPRNVTVEDMADDVLALMDGLGIGRAHFLGHAAGAAIGLALALRDPDRLASLAAVNGWSRLDPHSARCFEARMALLRDSGPRAYLRAQPLFLFPAVWISEHATELDRELEGQLAQFPGAEMMEARIAALQAFHIHDRLDEIETPILAVAAKDDMLVPWTCSPAYADRLANGSVALMDWGGHACNVTDPATFNHLVLEFLRS